MSVDRLAFDMVTEPMGMRRNTHTVVRLPDAVVAALPECTRPVDGPLEECSVNRALARATEQPRGQLHLVNTAKRADTRAECIATLIAEP